MMGSSLEISIILLDGLGSHPTSPRLRRVFGKKTEKLANRSVLRSFSEVGQNTPMHYVYILKLSNGDYYTGETNDLKRRLEEHRLGRSPTTNRFLPIELVSYTALSNKTKAEEFEEYLKTGSGIAFRNKHLV